MKGRLEYRTDVHFSGASLKTELRAHTYSETTHCAKLIKMSPTLHLSRMFAATMVLIALLAVPSIAQAHSGHNHGLQPAPAAPTGHDPASVDGSTGELPAAAKALEVRPSASDKTPSCAGSCCSGAPCGGCLALSFVNIWQYGSPLPAAPGEWRDPMLLAGLAPEGLRKPPRSFI